MSRKADHTPFLIGLGLIGLGLAARRVEPDALRLPEPAERPDLRNIRSGKDAARAARDGIAGFVPRNLTKSLGRTMILMGAALVAIRALDELVEDDTADY
ncbi:hypothetical protein SAMN05421759_104183 [Roseivivax lentus]|uniref:Uncharacterized protein n=1 Tax=Roseivivax lentus TaxID=633194 RepID=A0A1N7MCA9_9RHOB|nr:hypothetical protein [Roseivivax lentus]SIS83693.1 hypothetical protein SAMN05421759_104183 [Roseivivax lentus]